MMIAGLVITLSLAGCNNSGNNSSDGAEKEKKVAAPKTDIHTAALTGNMEVIQQHIAAGTNLDQKDPIGGATALITACVFGRAEVAEALIDAGADLEVKNNDGSTALHCAALFGHKDLVIKLLDHGADKNATNNMGHTPLVTVVGPFEEVKPVYDFFQKQLGPLGLDLDYDQLKRDRPQIADILQ